MTTAPQRRRGDGRQRLLRIYETLRLRICLLDYPPGHRLREEDLAAEFAASRTPIRRVLARLEDEGLLRSVHGVGTIVTDIDIAALAEVYELRVALAELYGRLAPVAPDGAGLDRFRAVLSGCDALVERPDARAFARLNMEFFALIATLTANAPLRQISERLYYQTTRIWLKTAARLAAYERLLAEEIAHFRREVADVLAALEAGDLANVGAIRRAHIAMSFARLRAQAERAAPGG